MAAQLAALQASMQQASIGAASVADDWNTKKKAIARAMSFRMLDSTARPDAQGELAALANQHQLHDC